MNTRIKEIISHERLSDGEFADRTKINRSTLSHCLSGRNSVSNDIITKIHNAYPNISLAWLMFGEGESGFGSIISNNNSSNYANESVLFDCGTDNDKYSKENELNTPNNLFNYTDNKDNSTINNTAENFTQIEKIVLPSRKVEKIILYYTDGTFETFTKN